MIVKVKKDFTSPFGKYKKGQEIDLSTKRLPYLNHLMEEIKQNKPKTKQNKASTKKGN